MNLEAGGFVNSAVNAPLALFGRHPILSGYFSVFVSLNEYLY